MPIGEASLACPSLADVQAAPASACLAADDLRQRLLGALPQREQAQFERHVVHCRDCQQQMDWMQIHDPFIEAIGRNAVRSDYSRGDDDTEAYVSSRLTPSTPGIEAAPRALAEFVGNQRFRIDRRLGAGGMGIVHQAYDRDRQETVALKTLRRIGEAAALRLTQEFRALADLHHPNLVSLYELYVDDDRRFFTMELLDGDDFLTYLGGAENDGDVGVRIARLRHCLPQLAAGLLALHAAGKLHRDIKPSNVIVTRGGRLALVDFGLAAEMEPAGVMTQFVAGTAAYMSPEQAAGGRLTPASDWYSVGVMLFEALTGRLPFTGKPLEIMARKQVEEPLPLDYWARELPGDLQTLCADLLRAQPDERPPGAEVAVRLGVAARRAAAGPTIAPPAAPLFVGREHELQSLHGAFDAVVAGRASVVLLRGPSGVGKTAVCAEFLRQLAERRGAIVLAGRCYERELVPYKAADSFMESLVDYLQSQPDAEVRAWCPEELPAAVYILPILRRLAAVEAKLAETGPPVGDLPDRKRRAFAALRELLRRITARQPVVFFIDDLQWGDADSPSLFAEWLRGPNAPRVLLVGAFRDEAADGGPWLKTWRDIERKSGFAWASNELRIGPLPSDEASQLARNLAANSGRSDDDDSLADTIAEHAMGHPLYLRELVEHASQAGRVHGNLPKLSDIVGSRLGALDAEAYRLLEAVAAAGYPITLERAYRAAELPLGRRAALHSLIGANLARTVGDERLGKLVAYHDVVRETLLSRSSPAALRDAHRRLAEAAAAEDPPDEEALVLHYQGAGEAELAARFAASAADRAAGNLAFDLAIRCYRLALESPSRSGEEHHAIEAKLADALASAGRAREAAETYMRLAGSTVGDESLRFAQAAGVQYIRATSRDEAMRALDSVFRNLKMRPPPAGRGPLVLHLLYHRAWLSLIGYRSYSRRPGSIDPRLLGQIDLCSQIGGVLTYLDYLRGAALIMRASHLALKSGDDSRVAIALAQEACMSALNGNLRRAVAFGTRAETLAQRVQDDFALSGVICARGIGLIVEGQWLPALQAFDLMKDLVRRCPGKRTEAVQAESYSHYAFFYSGKLRLLAEGVSEHLQDAIEHEDRLGAALLRLNMGNIAWLAGDRPDEARRQIEETLRQWPDVTGPMRYLALAAQLRIDLYLGRGAAAWRRLQEEWPRLARSGLLRAAFFSIEAHHLRASSALAVLGQETSDRSALPRLRRSIRFLERQGFGWTGALASLARAGLLEATGRSAAAIEAYGAAQSLFAAAEMPLYAAAAQRRLGELLADDRLIAAADTALIEHGASNPRRLAAMLAGL